MYTTLTSKEGSSVIDVRLQKPIEGFTRVGVADFFYNRGELELDLNDEEHTVYIEYDLKTSKEIVLFQDVEDNDKSITPFHFFKY